MVELIAIDGIDGSGKTTVSRYLQKYLEKKGKKVLIIEQPKISVLGNLVFRLLTERRNKAGARATTTPLTLSFLYTIDFLLSIISHRLKKGVNTVIFVRYTLTAAYLPERIGTILYLFLAKLLPVPDIMIYLDVSVKTALNRLGSIHVSKRFQITEDPKLLRTTNVKMKKLSKLLKYPKWKKLNNESDLETLYQRVEEIYDNQ
ncbi:MAG: hypothetical protein FWD52_09515 [Candidatus Bathyarchaeota archaeon]|nr:hypothetical protein [Candidatus Termitimicrobium sp.]MCL2643720.1 hypothetical protein [Candidatus Termiticorpusculum sp.]